MSDTPRPTIFALSSGRVPAAIAVVRISGPRAGNALTALDVKIPEPRKAGLARVRDPQSGEMIDEALALWFPGPHSETGEDVAELQLHGGRAVIAATLAALGRIDGLRPAEAGEFTRRAFENGKLDLTAVEGLADLVGAETEAQRRQAFRQMKGALGRRAESWRERLIQALALVEARIDFSDEADVPEDLVRPALEIAGALASEISAALNDGTRGERLREGLVVAIAGPPNAGKSTLLNRIARREAAIVSPYAGTTRDVIEVHLDLDGWPVTLLDTAGIRETEDPVELEGVRRARDRAAAADLVLWVEEAGGLGAGKGGTSAGEWRKGAFGHSAEGGLDRMQTAALSEQPKAAQTPPICWFVRNKADLLSQIRKNELGFPSEERNELELPLNETLKNVVNQTLPHKNEYIIENIENRFIVSAETGEGIDSLLKALADFAAEFLTGAESGLITRERHRLVLGQAYAALKRALSLGSQEDLLAEELRTAAAAVGRLTGRVDVEDVLDVIFRDFCIGK
ncbi:tRNA uridine-5-carboxymethylaminomethyl(34) synthesis GTPase MnmE [Microbacteriaceae bacterium K1510]|nr:tRNA uridine-5-carboxymethylaminomethyl(34) synthesis GTPase MnmE [Microbacteriaceae bacterium K1510]